MKNKQVRQLLWFCFIGLIVPTELLAQEITNTGNKELYATEQEAFFTDFTNTTTGNFIQNGTLYVHSNYIDNGLTTFSGTTGTTHWIGTVGQTISGTGTTGFYNTVFNNDKNITLSKDISVSGVATYTKGIIHGDAANGGVFIFNNGATYSGVSDIAHVDGIVRKIGNEAFTFPVGDAGFYRYATISAPANTSDSFTAQYLKADGTTVYGTATEPSVKNVNKNEYWVIERTAGTSTPTVTLSWDTGKTSSITTADLSRLVITRWDGTKWVNEGQVSTTGNATSGTITANVSGYGAFTFAENACINVNLHVYLEGALVDVNTGDAPSSGPYVMRTTLNSLGLLPGQVHKDDFQGNTYIPVLGTSGQGYNVSPWNYSGTEGSGYDSEGDVAKASAGYASTVVDWVLVSFRTEATNKNEYLHRQAALLHSDGRVEFVGASCINLDVTKSYYVIVEHRNHLMVMSANKVNIVNNEFIYDFRAQQSYIYDEFSPQNFTGQIQLSSGVYAMAAGNGDQQSSGTADTDINAGDVSLFRTKTGTSNAYNPADFNLSGDINTNDIRLLRNSGKATSIKRN